jgi:hypothetical protein
MSVRMNRAMSDRTRRSESKSDAWPWIVLAAVIVITVAFSFNHPRHIGYVPGGISRTNR